MPPTLQAENISLCRGGNWLFADLNFLLKSGEILTLHGPNGCGKSSLLRVIAGMLMPNTGQIMMTQNNTKTIWYAEKDGMALDLTVLQTIHLNLNIYNQYPKLHTILKHDRFSISHCLNTPIRQLSNGQRQRVALSMLDAFLGADYLWLLDEPNSHLDEYARAQLDALINQHKNAQGMAVIASHLPITTTTQIMFGHNEAGYNEVGGGEAC